VSPVDIYVHRRRALWRRLLDVLRDVPYIFTDAIGADDEPRWAKALMALMLLSFGAAMGIWLAAYWMAR